MTDATETTPVAPTGSVAGITLDEKVPPRSRTFTPDHVATIVKAFAGELEGQTEPAKNVGFGTFDTAGAARSAGVTLNDLIMAEGTTDKPQIKRAVSAIKTEGNRYKGIMWNKPAAARPASGNGTTTTRKRGAAKS